MERVKKAAPRSRSGSPESSSSRRGPEKGVLTGRKGWRAAREIAAIDPKWAWHCRRLLALRERVLKEKKALVETAQEEKPVYSMSMADAATDEFDRDLTLSQLSSEQEFLYEIEEALRRIQTNCYGICELTGQPIPEARLRAVPWTRFTRDAEANLEEKKGVSAPHLGKLESVRGATSGDLEESEVSDSDEEPTSEDERLHPSLNLPSPSKSAGKAFEETSKRRRPKERKTKPKRPASRH
jgi:RNA polymerase-binding transcription factor DksA